MYTIEIASIALRDSTAKLKAVGHNVANVETPGFKRQVLETRPFSEAMSASAAAEYSRDRGALVDMRPGALRATGEPLDVAMGPRDFLVVQRSDGEMALVRGGSLRIGTDGRLVTSTGLPLLEQAGTLSAPMTATDVRIDGSARLRVDDRVVGQLRVVRVPEGTPLRADGDGVYLSQEAEALPSVDHPTVQVGHLERSNVVGSQEMVHLMTAFRHAEAMVKLIQGADEMLDKAIRRFGESQ